MKMPETVWINANENWGGLVDPKTHDAAIGARFADNKARDFGIFGDRITIVGEKKVADRLKKWLFSKKILDKIRCNTSFVWGTDGNGWASRFTIGKNIGVTLDVWCAGEYVQVRAYADKMPSGMLDVVPTKDKDGEACFRAVMVDRPGVCGPLIYANNQVDAMYMLLDYVANELDGAEDLKDPW